MLRLILPAVPLVLAQQPLRKMSTYTVSKWLYSTATKEKGEALASELGGVFCEVNVTSCESVDAGFEKSRDEIGQERILEITQALESP